MKKTKKTLLALVLTAAWGLGQAAWPAPACPPNATELSSAYLDALKGLPGGEARLTAGTFAAVKCLAHTDALVRERGRYSLTLALLARFQNLRPVVVASESEAKTFANLVRALL